MHVSPNLPIDAKTNCYYSIQPPDVSESLAPQTQDTILNLDSYLPPANSVHSQSPISTRVHRQGGAEPSGSYGVPVPYPNFNAHPAAEDNILSLTSTGNPCQSCGRYDPSCHIIPSSSSTGSLNMEYGVEPYQQFLDPNTQYFIPQPIQPYVSNASSTVTFPGHSYDIYAAITGSSDLMMTSESANDETVTALPFPNSSYDTKYPHNYYM